MQEFATPIITTNTYYMVEWYGKNVGWYPYTVKETLYQAKTALKYLRKHHANTRIVKQTVKREVL